MKGLIVSLLLLLVGVLGFSELKTAKFPMENGTYAETMFSVDGGMTIGIINHPVLSQFEDGKITTPKGLEWYISDVFVDTVSGSYQIHFKELQQVWVIDQLDETSFSIIVLDTAGVEVFRMVLERVIMQKDNSSGVS